MEHANAKKTRSVKIKDLRPGDHIVTSDDRELLVVQEPQLIEEGKGALTEPYWEIMVEDVYNEPPHVGHLAFTNPKDKIAIIPKRP